MHGLLSNSLSIPMSFTVGIVGLFPLNTRFISMPRKSPREFEFLRASSGARLASVTSHPKQSCCFPKEQLAPLLPRLHLRPLWRYDRHSASTKHQRSETGSRTVFASVNKPPHQAGLPNGNHTRVIGDKGRSRGQKILQSHLQASNYHKRSFEVTFKPPSARVGCYTANTMSGEAWYDTPLAKPPSAQQHTTPNHSFTIHDNTYLYT